MNYALQGYIANKDKERKEALSSQDAIKYYTLCEELGIPAEDEFLHERGQLEIKLKNEIK